MCKHAAKGNGLQNLFEFMIESMPVAERNEFLTAISSYGCGKQKTISPISGDCPAES